MPSSSMRNCSCVPSMVRSVTAARVAMACRSILRRASSAMRNRVSARSSPKPAASGSALNSPLKAVRSMKRSNAVRSAAPRPVSRTALTRIWAMAVRASFKPVVRHFFGARQFLAQRIRIVHLKLAQQAHLAEHGHHRVGEGVVQVAGDLQAFAHDGGVARFLGKTLDFARSDGDSALELAAQRSAIRCAPDAERPVSWRTRRPAGRLHRGLSALRCAPSHCGRPRRPIASGAADDSSGGAHPARRSMRWPRPGRSRSTECGSPGHSRADRRAPSIR